MNINNVVMPSPMAYVELTEDELGMIYDHTFKWYIEHHKPSGVLEHALRVIAVMETTKDLNELEQELDIVRKWLVGSAVGSLAEAITTAIWLRREDMHQEDESCF